MRTFATSWMLMLCLVPLIGCDHGISPTRSPLGPSGLPAPRPPSPGLYVLSGVVSDPAGVPVPNVRVQTAGKRATTDEAGRFFIGDVSSFIGSMLLTKEGYEEQLVPAEVPSRDRVVNAFLPQTIRLAAGESNVMTLYPNDVRYDFPEWSEYCVSCKRIRITIPGRGILSFTMRPDDPAQRLLVYTDEGRIQYCCSAQVAGALEFPAAGEAVVYVSFLNGVSPGTEGQIEMSTSFRSR